MITESKRLILRKFQKSDLDTLLKYRTDPLVAKYQSWGIDLTRDQAQQFIEHMSKIDLYTETDWIQIAFELKEDSTHIGDCGIKRFDDGRQMEIGVGIDRDYWEQGFAFEGLSAIFSFIFSNLNVHRIIAISDTRNDASIRLLTKLGMRKEGHTVESYKEDDKWTDEYLFAILDREW